jgi:Helicase HerA, central domain
MRLRSRLFALFLFVILLVVAGFIAEGNVKFFLNEFWFNAGILMLILAVFIDQPFFSTESNVVLNGAAAAVSLIGVNIENRGILWAILLVFAIYLIITSSIIAYYRAGRTTSIAKSLEVISALNRKLGRPQVLFSILFLWGAVLKFGLMGKKSNILYLYWAFFILFDFIGIGRLFDRILYPISRPVANRLGIVRGTIEPNLVEVELGSNERTELGMRVDFRVSNSVVASGVLIDDRAMAGLRIGRIVLDKTESDWARAISESPSSLILEASQLIQGEDKQERFVGIIETGTDISSVRTLVRPDCAIEEGSLLEVSYCEGKKAYFQVVGGKVTDLTPEGNASYRSVSVIAEQLGFWTESACFESVPWVIRANTPIYVMRELRDCKHVIPDGRIVVGNIPNSDFPIHVGVEDIVTHNTAILGVTGSGKSYLAFFIVEGLMETGIRVLILDPSRQHFTFLKSHNPTPITELTGLEAWLNSSSLLGIYQFADAKSSFPAKTAEFINKIFEIMTQKVVLKPGETVPAHLCIVLEEAHSLIPEWNQVITQSDKDHVNRSSRILLQGRKFGIGVLVITQRTANVVKTILNQCNTIFALQCFDQTGLEFLQNYMGESYARSLSVLPRFHAVLVGKASSSARPVIFKVMDLSKRWCSQPEKTTSTEPAAVEVLEEANGETDGA